MKRGDWVRVWDDDKSEAARMRYVAYIEGKRLPHICVNEWSGDLEAFESGKPFDTVEWKHAEPIEDNREGIVNGTRVLVWRDGEKVNKFPRYATGEWDGLGRIVCWHGGADEWGSEGLKTEWENWEIYKKPWQPKVGDRVKLVKPFYEHESRENPVWGGRYGKIGGTIHSVSSVGGRMEVEWDNGKYNAQYTTEHLQPL